jgi:hypothetical protein
MSWAMMGRMDRSAGIGISEDHLALAGTVRRWVAAHCPPAVPRALLDADEESCPRSGTSSAAWAGWASTCRSATAARATASPSWPSCSRSWAGPAPPGRSCPPRWSPRPWTASATTRWRSRAAAAARQRGAGSVPPASGLEPVEDPRRRRHPVLTGRLGRRARRRSRRRRPGPGVGDPRAPTRPGRSSTPTRWPSSPGPPSTGPGGWRGCAPTAWCWPTSGCSSARPARPASRASPACCWPRSRWAWLRGRWRARRSTPRSASSSAGRSASSRASSTAAPTCWCAPSRPAAPPGTPPAGRPDDSDELRQPASGRRAIALESSFENAKDCIQVLGGIGFTWEHAAHMYLKRAAAGRLLVGTPAPWRAEAGRLALAGDAPGPDRGAAPGGRGAPDRGPGLPRRPQGPGTRGSGTSAWPRPATSCPTGPSRGAGTPRRSSSW